MRCGSTAAVALISMGLVRNWFAGFPFGVSGQDQPLGAAFGGRCFLSAARFLPVRVLAPAPTRPESIRTTDSFGPAGLVSLLVTAAPRAALWFPRVRGLHRCQRSGH